jgi:hypothetical protein
MKIKPDPALLQTSYLSNEIKKRKPKSRETFPLIFTVFMPVFDKMHMILFLGSNMGV